MKPLNKQIMDLSGKTIKIKKQHSKIVKEFTVEVEVEVGVARAAFKEASKNIYKSDHALFRWLHKNYPELNGYIISFDHMNKEINISHKENEI